MKALVSFTFQRKLLYGVNLLYWVSKNVDPPDTQPAGYGQLPTGQLPTGQLPTGQLPTGQLPTKQMKSRTFAHQNCYKYIKL